MKHREFTKCQSCERGVGDGGLTFYRVRIEHFVLIPGAIQRAVGFETMLGGNALLANIMGPDDDLAKRIGEPVAVLVCQDCAIDPPEGRPAMSIAETYDRLQKQRSAKKEGAKAGG